MTPPFTDKTVLDYLNAHPEWIETLFDGDRELTATALTEGNVNVIFRVQRVKEPQQSVIVKQALPHSWRYPDFKMPVERSRIEYEVLTLHARYSPEQTVKIHFHDDTQHVNVLEDLNQHVVMREGLAQQGRYPQVGEHVGKFMARSLFYTSDFYLSSGEKKALVARFINPVMVKVQEDLVFTQPFAPHPNNRWTRGIEAQVEAIYRDEALQQDVLGLKFKYMTAAEALLHNDLHTGSILVNEHETKVIDPEFAFFGPMAHDIGSYLANLAIAYAAQEFHGKTEQSRGEYRSWLSATLVKTWNTFENEFLGLWENEGNGEYKSERFRRAFVAALLQDTAGFGAAEIIRRLIGLAHVWDLWTITDETVRARVESLGLNVATAWLRERREITSADALAELLTLAQPTAP